LNEGMEPIERVLLHPICHWSATYGRRAGSALPSNIIRPADPLQIVVIVWPS